MELLVAVSIVGILASLALPQYRKTVERSYWQSAQDILYTIHAGEEVYYRSQSGSPAYIIVTTAVPNWGAIYMDNPNAGSPPYPTRFSVPTADATTFLAIADRGDTRCMSINQARDLVTDVAPAGCTNAWPKP